MNTRKQVLIMTTLLLLMLIVIGIYAAWYPSRSEDSAEHFLEATSERGSILFARNCRICHGNLGEGGALGARLPAAPALDRPDLQGFLDTKATLVGGVDLTSTTFEVNDGTALAAGDVILVDKERMEVEEVEENMVTVARGLEHTDAAQHFADAVVYKLDESAFDTLNPNSTRNLITNTITCGRVGTAMPIWGLEHGGSLSDEQIRQLTTLIMQGRWDLVQEEIDNEEEDLIDSEFEAPLGADVTEIEVSDVTRFTEGEALRVGGERLRVVSVETLPTDRFGELPDDRRGLITLERGVLGTVPLNHSQDSKLFRFPETPEGPSITERACGQTAQAPAPAGEPELIEPFEGQTVEVAAFNILFDTNEITVDSGGQVRLRFDNQEAVRHNIAVYNSSTDLTPASPGSVGIQFEGPDVDDTVFDVPAAGEYYFRCDVHPTLMVGTFTVQ
jgi:plastocyanin